MMKEQIHKHFHRKFQFFKPKFCFFSFAFFGLKMLFIIATKNSVGSTAVVSVNLVNPQQTLSDHVTQITSPLTCVFLSLPVLKITSH